MPISARCVPIRKVAWKRLHFRLDALGTRTADRCTGRNILDDERVNPLGVTRRIDIGRGPAHRMAKQREASEAKSLNKHFQIAEIKICVIIGCRVPIAFTPPALIECDNAAAVTQCSSKAAPRARIAA